MGWLNVKLDGQEYEVRLRERRLPERKTRPLSKWLIYIVESFSAYSVLASFAPEEPSFLGINEWWKGQALLTSYLLRARQLDEFLYPESGEKRDPNEVIDVDLMERLSRLTSYDLVRDPAERAQKRPDRGRDLRGVRRRINSSVAHLDLRVLDERFHPDHNPYDSKQRWNVSDLWKWLRPALEAFDENLDEEAVNGDFQRRFRAALKVQTYDQVELSDWLRSIPSEQNAQE